MWEWVCEGVCTHGCVGAWVSYLERDIIKTKRERERERVHVSAIDDGSSVFLICRLEFDKLKSG